jgi:hypothetical protein
MMKSTLNEVLKLARDALKQTDDAIQKFVLLESLPEPVSQAAITAVIINQW